MVEPAESIPLIEVEIVPLDSVSKGKNRCGLAVDFVPKLAPLMESDEPLSVALLIVGAVILFHRPFFASRKHE